MCVYIYIDVYIYMYMYICYVPTTLLGFAAWGLGRVPKVYRSRGSVLGGIA